MPDFVLTPSCLEQNLTCYTASLRLPFTEQAESKGGHMGGTLKVQKVAVLTLPMDANVKLPSHYSLVMQAAGQAGCEGDWQ